MKQLHSSGLSRKIEIGIAAANLPFEQTAAGTLSHVVRPLSDCDTWLSAVSSQPAVSMSNTLLSTTHHLPHFSLSKQA
jgi:hypothetical protein